MAREIEPRESGKPARTTPWEYAPAPESRDIVSIKPRYDLFVGGRFVTPGVNW